jgi:hypothetical protein
VSINSEEVQPKETADLIALKGAVDALVDQAVRCYEDGNPLKTEALRSFSAHVYRSIEKIDPFWGP